MLSYSQRHDVPFDKAWESAFARVRWPHDTEHRQGWKELLIEQREDWRRAYQREGKPNKSLLALLALLGGGSDRLAA